MEWYYQQLALLRLIQSVCTGTVAAATALVVSDAPKDQLGSTLGKLQLAIISAYIGRLAPRGVKVPFLAWTQSWFLFPVLLVLPWVGGLVIRLHTGLLSTSEEYLWFWLV